MEWPAYACFICGKSASFRFFCGVYSDGWSACDGHASRAIDLALAPLVDTKWFRGTLRVRAYAVVWNEYGPGMYFLWRAKPRAALW